MRFWNDALEAPLKGLRLAGFKLLCVRRPALGRLATFSQ
jgi:hypothetical protein